MVFFVSVASDVYGRKQNLRLEFITCPTITELINTSEAQYDVQARATRPAGYPDIPFRVQSFQVYDDVLMRWVDLYSSAQLTNGCQVYAFQPETIWNVDLVGTIPIARDTVTWSSYTGSPRRARLAADAGAPASLSEKLRSVFYDIDSGNKGYVLYSDLRAAFLRADINFDYATVGELFNRADTNRDGSISYEEWVRFAIDYPSIVDALFFRARDLIIPRITPTTEEILSTRRARELELERLYRDSSIAAERARAQREYDDARREAELARTRASLAAASERRALDRMYYAPGSPRRYY
jgi:hypothetical protein